MDYWDSTLAAFPGVKKILLIAFRPGQTAGGHAQNSQAQAIPPRCARWKSRFRAT